MLILSTSFSHYCYCSKRKVEKIIILKIVALYKYHYSKKEKEYKELQKNNTQTTVKKKPQTNILFKSNYILLQSFIEIFFKKKSMRRKGNLESAYCH
jgi:hypothetical protein